MDFNELINESGKLTLEEIKQIQKYEDASKLIIAACMLKLQTIKFTRDGAIIALKSSLNVAPKEIREKEAAGRASYEFPQFIPFEQLSNEKLLSLLPTYFEGLEEHCINNFGRELYEKCFKIIWDCLYKNMY